MMLAGILCLAAASFAHGAAAPALAPSSRIPAGYWESVDLVDSIEGFEPGRRSWPEDLFLKDFECGTDGRCSLGWTCKDGWTTHGNGKTRAPYVVKVIDGEPFFFLPWLSGDVVVRGMEPSFYVLRKADKTAVRTPREKAAAAPQAAQSASAIKPFDDVRGKDLSGLDLSRPGLVATLTFNERTIWPKPETMGSNDDPRRLMSSAMNPGLGVRELHRQGITGAGVAVAIIDQPLLDDHPEFAGKLAAYRDFECGSDNSMHGPAVASLLVGAKCGTAPGAKVYYAAVPSWKADASYYARALDWILEKNAGLQGQEKIRVVSVSAMPSGRGSPFTKNTKAWDEARARARAQGVLVLDATAEEAIVGPCHFDPRGPENASECAPGFPGRGGRFPGLVLAPVAPRTVAEQYKRGEPSYQYDGRAGLSWAIPYAAGVLALGWQTRPDLTAERMQELLFKSAHVTEQGEKIIDPAGFIELVKAAR